MWTLALLIAAASPTSAASSYLAQGDAALDGLEYKEALEAYTLAVAAGDATPAELEHAHLCAGIAARVAGDETEARMHFLAALSADPDAQLPPRNESLSPKVKTFFDLVRTELRATRAPASPGSTPAGSTSTPAAAAPPELARTTPPDPRSPPGAPAAPRGPPLALVLAGAGGGVAVVGGGLALVADALVADAGRPLDERRTWQQTGWVALGGAGLGMAAAVVGVVMAVAE